MFSFILSVIDEDSIKPLEKRYLTPKQPAKFNKLISAGAGFGSRKVGLFGTDLQIFGRNLEANWIIVVNPIENMLRKSKLDHVTK